MSWFCGLRLGRKRAVTGPPNVDQDDIEKQPRPYSGSTAVGTSSAVDAGSEKKEWVEPEREPEKRSRSRSVNQRLTLAETFTSALRGRARSRSQGGSLSHTKTPPTEDDEAVPALPPKDDEPVPALPPKDDTPSPVTSDKPPRLSLEKAKRLTMSVDKPRLINLDSEQAARLTLVGEEAPDSDVRGGKPPRLELGPVGAAWPLEEAMDEKDDKRSSSGSTAKRTNSVDSLDTPISPPDSPVDEKKQRLSDRMGDINRDSKMKDEGLVDGPGETEEEARRRKMRESRQRLKEVDKDEQERLDMFQCF